MSKLYSYQYFTIFINSLLEYGTYGPSVMALAPSYYDNEMYINPHMRVRQIEAKNYTTGTSLMMGVKMNNFQHFQ